MIPLRAIAFALTSGWLAGTAVMAAPAVSVSPNTPTVALPPFVVEQSAIKFPWRHVSLPGLEILSSCSRSVTEDFATSQVQLQQLLQVLVPDEFRLQTSTPRIIVLVDDRQIAAGADRVAHELMAAEVSRELGSQLSASLVQKAQAAVGPPFNRANAEATGPATGPIYFMPNLRLWSGDTELIFTVVRSSDFDAGRLTFDEDEFQFLLTQRRPPLPRWLVEGMVGLYHQATLTRRQANFAPAVWYPPKTTKELTHSSRAPHDTVPVAELFLPAKTQADGSVDDHEQLRRAELVLFLRWVFNEPTGNRRRTALWQLVTESGLAPPSEASFKKFFHQDFAWMRDTLDHYLPDAVRGNLPLHTGRLTSPLVDASSATPRDIALYKGAWEHFEYNYVQAHQREFAPAYRDRARHTLHRAYDQGDHDPRLLAELGLLEIDAAQPAAARPFLEAAVAGGVVRPRVYAELARLRLVDRLGPLETSSKKLTDAETAATLKLLFTARAQLPPLSDVYMLIAAVWHHASTAPTRANLAVLDEGVRFFPYDAALAFEAARLYSENGYIAESRDFIRLGLATAADPTVKARLNALDQGLKTR